MRLPSLLALCGLLLAACSRDAPGPPDLEVRRLADEAAVGRPVAREQIDGVLRPVLPATHVEVLAPPPSVRAAGDGGSEATVRCPAPLAGRPVLLFVGSKAAADAGLEPLMRRLRCPASAGAPMTVALPAYPGIEQAVWLVRGLTVDHTQSQALHLVAGARLRAHLGVAPAVPGTPTARGRFRVLAIGAGGRRAPVLDRRLDPVAAPADARWVPVDVDLEPVRRVLGPDVRLVFGARADDAGDAAGFPIWGDPEVVWPRARGGAPRPARNVVLISLDTLRPDRLGLYGARRPTSPALDALAADATVFETVIAPAPWTLPSHTSMMTGLHACVHGMMGTIGHPFPAGLRPLAQSLREAGYATAAVTEDGFVDATAFVRGFGYYHETRDGDDRVRRTVAQAEAWLRDEATEPFFLFVHTYQTHEPYFSPPPYDAMFTTVEGPSGPVPLAQAAPAEAALAKYDAAVRYTDASIAPLLDAIRAAPRGDRTVLIVTSDHGEAFGEHGYTGHGRTLHEEVLRVPLLVRAPGLVASGRRVPGLAGVIDVAPTVLDLLGLPVPPDLTGVSLAPALRPGDATPLPPRLLFSENGLHDIRRLAIRSARWKAMFDNDQRTIVDLEHDPTERGDAPVAETVTREVEAARARFEDDCRRQKAALEAAAAAQAPEPMGLPDAGRQRQLRALGYVE